MHGFALLSTSPVELRMIALMDPFMGDYTHHYLLQVAHAIKSLTEYELKNLGKEINDISGYLTLSDFFQSEMENKGLVNTCLLSPIYN